jgi:hypothetical protein
VHILKRQNVSREKRNAEMLTEKDEMMIFGLKEGRMSKNVEDT